MSDYTFRPSMFGPGNKKVLRSDLSEVSMRAVNDANGNPTHVGYAQLGTATSAEKWQIRKITYDANQGVTKIEWPEDSNGRASNDYEFVWDDVLTYTYV